MTGSAPDMVALTALSLRDVRNYATLSVRFEPGLVALTGPNGAGKTNLLESISLLSPGRGLRRAGFEEITRKGAAGGWAVAAAVTRAGEETRIGTGMTPGEGSRKVRVNGASVPSAEALQDYLRVLWLTPAMDSLFTGPAGDRRRFLDRLVLAVDPGHARRARDFDRLLTQRNRLLEDNASTAWLDAVEAQLAATALAVALARAETVSLVSGRLRAQPGDASGFPQGHIALTGAFETAIAGRPAAEAELWYRDTLAAARRADRAAGRTLDGPHRSDLEIVFAEKDMPAADSSTGEQKALIIGTVLAHAEIVASVSGMAPVLLLDEVAAHLDPARRGALFARLAALGSQAFMTGTDAALFEALPGTGTLLHVDENRVGMKP